MSSRPWSLQLRAIVMANINRVIKSIASKICALFIGYLLIRAYCSPTGR